MGAMVLIGLLAASLLLVAYSAFCALRGLSLLGGLLYRAWRLTYTLDG